MKNVSIELKISKHRNFGGFSVEFRDEFLTLTDEICKNLKTLFLLTSKRVILVFTDSVCSFEKI